MKQYCAFIFLCILMLLSETQAQELPAKLIEAIARQESGFNPLAINVNGQSFFPNTKKEAENIIHKAQAAGNSYDVGLMQINSWWINHYGIPAEKLLEPEFNILWGKKILAQEIMRYGLNWQAVGRYHSPNMERGRHYAWRVYYQLVKPKVLDMPKGEIYAEQKTCSQDLPVSRGIWRNPQIGTPGRVIPFHIQQKGLSGLHCAKPGTPRSTNGTTSSQR